MSSNSNIILRVVLLVLAQILVCNNLNLFGFLNPYIYILYILLLPVQYNTMYLILSFVIGLVIDGFSDSGGIHAVALLTVTYLNPYFVSLSFGNNYSNKNPLEFSRQAFVYMIFIIFTHHFVMFLFEVFSFSRFLLVLKMTLLTSLFTLLLSIAIMPMLRK